MRVVISGSQQPNRSYRATYAALAGAGMVFALVQSLVAPLLPTIEVQLQTDATTVTWVLTAYLGGAAVATPVVGRLGDVVGKKRALVAVLGCFTLGCLIAALATSIGVLIAARALQGVGGALFPLAFGIIRDEFPPERVSGAIGTISSLLAIGSGTALVVGGPLLDHFGYAAVFWLPVAATALSTALVAIVVPESPLRAPGLPSVLPAVLLSTWLLALLLVISEGRRWGWLSGPSVGLSAVAGLVAVAWWAAEQRARRPVIDPQLLRLRAVWATTIVGTLVGATVYGTFVVLPRFLQTPASSGYGLGLTLTTAGFLLLPQTAGFALGGSLPRALGRWLEPRGLLVLAGTLSALGYGSLALTHSTAWQVGLAISIGGVGNGIAFAVLPAVVVGAVPAHQTGVAAGMNANVRLVGGAVGGQVAGVLVAAAGTTLGSPAERGFTDAFVFLAVTAVLSAVAAALTLGGLRGKPPHPERPLGTLAEAGTAAGSLTAGAPTDH